MRVEAKQTSVFEVIRWLSSDACHDLDDADMISVLGRRLQSTGIADYPTGLAPPNVASANSGSQYHVVA
jgi:hypothetical protein